jgi:hypothetical protein
LSAAARDTAAGAAVCVALLLPLAAAALLDERTLHDASIWSKPLKFAASFLVHQLTLLWLLRLLPSAFQDRGPVRWAMLAGAFSVIVELLYIVLQAARGRASHFNTETVLESILYFGVMGAGAVTLVSAAFVLGWTIWRQGRSDAGPGLRAGAASGLMLGAVATLLVGAVLSSGAVAPLGHWVGGVRSDAGGLLLTGWSATGGDLRVPHFFATHMMQVLPVLGLLADRLAPRNAGRVVIAGAAAGLLVTAATLAQAVAGLPFLRA